MLFPSWWQKCQVEHPFLSLAQGAAQGYYRLFQQQWLVGKQNALDKLKAFWGSFRDERFRSMDIIDMEHSLCEYAKFCKQVELNACYVKIHNPNRMEKTKRQREEEAQKEDKKNLLPMRKKQRKV